MARGNRGEELRKVGWRLARQASKHTLGHVKFSSRGESISPSSLSAAEEGEARCLRSTTLQAKFNTTSNHRHSPGLQPDQTTSQ